MTDDCESQDFYTLQEIGKSFKVISIKYKFYSKKRLYKYKKNIHSKYGDLTPIFRLFNIHLVFSNCPYKYKCILCTVKPVLNPSFKVKKTMH